MEIIRWENWDGRCESGKFKVESLKPAYAEASAYAKAPADKLADKLKVENLKLKAEKNS